MTVEHPNILDKLKKFTFDTHSKYAASLPDISNIVLASEGARTHFVHQNALLFMRKMKQPLEVNQYRNERIQVGTVILNMLIPYIGHYTFCRLGQGKMVEKFLFNSLPSLMWS